jgi:hypothetical protein
VNGGVALGISRNRLRGVDHGAGRSHEGDLNPGDGPARRIRHLGNQRVGQRLTYRGSNVLSLYCRNARGLAVARKEQIVSTTGGDEKRDEQRDG